jgi:SAM-dependent methyltransferase
MSRSVDWELAYQKEETPWDKGEAAPVLPEVWVRGVLAGRVLVPGCGRGHDARWLARQSGTEVVGLDLAPSAVAEARRLAGPSGARFELGDLFGLSREWNGAFDSVWEHTCFCAIPPERRPEYVRAMEAVLRPGGILAGVFFLNPAMDPGEEGPPFQVSVAELDHFFSDGFEKVMEWAPEVAYPGREGREWVMVWRRRG